MCLYFWILLWIESTEVLVLTLYGYCGSRIRQFDMTPDELKAEQAKRDSRITPAQRQAWSDGLLEAMVDTPAYRLKCTKEARLAEQARLLKSMEELEAAPKANTDSAS